MQQLLNNAERGKPDFYKKNLPIPFVLMHEGVELIARGKGLSCACPLHEDSDPSFDTWEEPAGWRWNCPPCGTGGDVLDLLQALGGSTFGEAMTQASDLVDQIPQGWVPPVTAGSRSVWDAAAEQSKVDRAQLDERAVWTFVADKSLDLDPEDLRQDWSLGSQGDEIVVPYWNRAGDLVAWKHRTATTPAIAAPGSQLRSVLYGEWKDRDPDKPVLLCEGESDVWVAHSIVGRDFAVLGAPGAGAHPKATGLEGRTVYLAFDGDEAGRKATARWSAFLLEHGCSVRFVPVPEGKDLRTTPDLRTVLTRSRTLKPAPESFKEMGDIYVRPGKEVNTMLTNWRLEPTRELVTDEGMTAYEGTLIPQGKTVVLSSADLATKSRIVSWCSRYGVAWLGADRDAQALLALLQSVGPYLPSGQMVDTAGLHDSSFVWPGGRVGSASLVYDAPSYDVHLEQRLTLPVTDWTPLQVPTIRDLHERRVTDPILGWLAAAPLRSLLPSFPTLAVTGSSGSGKTTLLSTMIRAFSGADISTNLTSTTKHALASFLACTNSFPVWFDEYRPGARKDTQMALEQLLRDAYTAQISAKGGLGEHWSEINAMQTHAPIVVSGEDTFTETSHTERFINLPLPSRGKNPDALRDVKNWGPTGLPNAYLTWLSRQLSRDALYLVPQPTGPEDLPGRQRDNLGVVRWGWNLLDQFCQESGLPALGDPDLSLVIDAGAEASHHNPIKDAIKWALEEAWDCSGFVTADTANNVYLRVTSFTAYIERHGTFRLPGRAAAVERYVRDHFEAVDGTHNFAGRPVSCLVFPESMLD